MLKSGKTTFSEIAKIVNTRSGHRISRRTNVVQSRRAQRLKSLGVRSTSRKLTRYAKKTDDEEQIYKQAYRALKNSKKSWATEPEIRAILDGDKPLTHRRSAEVIEVLRQARVVGFKETDDVTSGDVYSERMITAMHKKQKAKAQRLRRERIQKLREDDERNVSQDKSNSKDIGPSPIKSIHLPQFHESESSAAPDSSYISTKRHGTQFGPKGGVLSNTKKTKRVPPQKKKDSSNKVPLTFDLSDQDL